MNNLVFNTSLKNVNLIYTGISLQLRSTVSSEKIKSLFHQITEEIEEFSLLKESGDDTFSFTNDTVNIEKQILAVITKKKLFQLAWGGSIPNDKIACIFNKFINILERNIEVNRLSMVHIDFKILANVELELNHHKLLNNLFYKTKVFNFITENDKIISNDIDFKSFINSDLVLAIKIRGGSSSTEILTNEYTKNKMIEIEVGIAKVYFNNFSNLVSEFEEHVLTAHKYLADKIEPKVLSLFEKVSND